MLAAAFQLDDESGSTWKNFFEFVKRTYPTIDHEGRTVIMDGDKGEISAFDNVFARMRKFMCARHRGQNVNKYFGQYAEGLYWQAVRATTRESLDNILDTFRKDFSERPEAIRYLFSVQEEEQFLYAAVNRDPQTRVFLFNRCTSQLVESLNNASKPSRGNHFLQAVLTLLSAERGRLHKQRKKMKKSETEESTLVPTANNVINDLHTKAIEYRGSITTRHRHNVDVQDGDQVKRVNLETMTCSCGIPDIHGEPCLHVYLAAKRKGYRDDQLFNHTYYCFSTWKSQLKGAKHFDISQRAT